MNKRRKGDAVRGKLTGNLDNVLSRITLQLFPVTVTCTEIYTEIF